VLLLQYTGDRLNFGMACEKANMEGIPCQMVVVADDCALERTKGITGARGVAGTVFIHKIVGAAAAKGASLQECADWTKAVSARMGTVGVAMDSVTVPGADAVNDRLDQNTIEIGLGIHGEAGMRQSPLLSAKDIAHELISTIQKYGRAGTDQTTIPMFQPNDELCILVNNLGGTSNFEMSILANSCVTLLEGNKFKAKVTRLFVGSYMTSFDMHGASLTILNLTGAESEMAELLDAATDAPAWAACDVWKQGEARASATEIPQVIMEDNTSDALTLPPIVELPNFQAVAHKMIHAAAHKLIDEEPTLTKYDTIVGDGDCGITMKRGAVELLKRLESGDLKTEHPVSMFAAIADAVSASMGGTSGVLLELMFRKMSSSLAREDTIGITQLTGIMRAGTDAIILYGGANVGSRTMLDALVPASDTLLATFSMVEAAAKAKEGANSTAALKTASAGRSNYLSEETLEGTPDPGATVVALVLQELANVA
jgi:triose/dihydroxyacetone kinase / FAD-AMP lyase (cyclizing)